MQIQSIAERLRKDPTSWFSKETLFNGLVFLFPFTVLTTELGHRVVPLLMLTGSILLIPGPVLRSRRAMGGLALAVLALSLSYYIGLLRGTIENNLLERISYGWVFVLIGLMLCKVRVHLNVALYGVAGAGLVTLISQFTQDAERPSYVFNIIPYANVAAAMFCLCAAYIPHDSRRWGKVLLAVGALLWVMVVAKTQTRGAILALTPGILLFIAGLLHQGQWRRVLWGGGALIVLVVAGAWVSKGVIMERMAEGVTEYEAYSEGEKAEAGPISIRLELWKAATMIVAENPLGVSRREAVMQAVRWTQQGELEPYIMRSLQVAHFHSDFFQHLALMGYPGALSFFGFYLVLVTLALRRIKEPDGQLLLALTASIFISGLTDVPMYTKLPMVTFYFYLMVVLTGMKRSSQRTSPHHPKT